MYIKNGSMKKCHNLLKDIKNKRVLQANITGKKPSENTINRIIETKKNPLTLPDDFLLLILTSRL